VISPPAREFIRRARATKLQALYFGLKDDFDEEIVVTRKNKRLMKFLSKRAASAKSQKGILREVARNEPGPE